MLAPETVTAQRHYPGRSGCGTSSRASTATASTAFVDGAITPVRMLRVATSTADRQLRAAGDTVGVRAGDVDRVRVDLHLLPRSERTGEVNGRPGRLSFVRRVVGAPKGAPAAVPHRCQPIQLPVARDLEGLPVRGAQRRPRHPNELVFRVIVDPAACPLIASRNADSTRSSAPATGSRPPQFETRQVRARTGRRQSGSERDGGPSFVGWCVDDVDRDQGDAEVAESPEQTA
jgi:hypothetical protein